MCRLNFTNMLLCCDQKVVAHDDVELEESLRDNLRDKLQQWKTALEEGTSSQGGQQLLSYIQQPCTLKKAYDEEQSDVPSAVQLAENSSPGDRMIIYGDAGMGKTTLLKHLAQSWIEKKNVTLLEKFKYVILIPMRFVGNLSLLNIICNELELVPVSSMKQLKICLDRNEKKTLFLLDSYEELRGDVIIRKKTEIVDLITGRMYPRSTVLVTSRPRSRLKYQDHYKMAKLKDLPEAEVKQIIGQHFGENERAVNRILRSFPAMSFLQKPINLALFLFIIKGNEDITLSYTQAELFNLMLQYIMLAYAKKKRLFEFSPQPGSYLKNKEIPREVRLLFQAVAKKCYEEKRKNSVILHTPDEDQLKDYMEFGLFAAGPDAHSVVLPHPLFQEYFTAAHLADNPEAWKVFFEEIRRQFESETPRLRLIDVVQPLMVDNVVRFAVALTAHVCENIGSLFVLEHNKMKDCDNYQLIKFEYYTDLLRDCSDENGKHILADALVSAPVKYERERTRIRDSGSSILLPYLNYRQRVDFLKNVYGLDLRVEGSKSTLSCSGKRLGISDKFVVSIVSLYNCTINADKLYIRGKNGCCIDIPASMVSRNMAGVRQLRLAWCKLHGEVSAEKLNMEMSNDVHTVEPASPSEKNISLRVELYKVQGLENCDVITSRRCHLEVCECDNVTVETVQACFPQLSDFELKFDTTLVYAATEDFSTWLSTVETVKELNLAPPQGRTCLNLFHLLSLLAEDKKVETLLLSRYTLEWNGRDTMEPASRNNTLSTLRLVECQGDVDMNKLLESSDLCHKLNQIEVESSSLILDGEDESVKQLPNLQSLILQKSPVHTPSGRRMSDEEAKQLLRRMCPSAMIKIGDKIPLYGYRGRLTSLDG